MREVASISVLGLLLCAMAVCACGSSEELSVGERSVQGGGSGGTNTGPGAGGAAGAGGVVADSGGDGRVPEVVMWRLICKISCPDASSSTGVGLPVCTALQTTGSLCTTPGVSCDPQVGPDASCVQGYYQRCGGNAVAIPCL